MRAFLVLVPVVLLAAGCSKGRPTLAGGRPVQHWLQALHDPRPDVRRAAVGKLGNVGTADPAAVPALREALQDSDARVRYEAILALLKCSSAAGAAVPALADMAAHDRDPAVRQGAQRALTSLQGASSP